MSVCVEEPTTAEKMVLVHNHQWMDENNISFLMFDGSMVFPPFRFFASVVSQLFHLPICPYLDSPRRRNLHWNVMWAMNTWHKMQCNSLRIALFMCACVSVYGFLFVVFIPVVLFNMNRMLFRNSRYYI